MQALMEVFGSGRKKAMDDGLMSLSDLTNKISNKWCGAKLLFEEGILNRPESCAKCGGALLFKKDDPYITQVKYEKSLVTKSASEEKACFIYRCKDRKCSWNQSVFHGTFFANSKKPCNEILMFLHLWLTGANVKTLRLLSGWSERAVLEYCSLFHKMVSSLIMHWIDVEVDPTICCYEDIQIGGEGVQVQIDESAFGKRKYNRGHFVETKWVFGGVEIVPDSAGRKRGGAFFSVVVADRKRDTLFEAIRKFIKPGSIIVSNKFKSYDTINEIEGYDFTHFAVNHSINYKDPISGACTNTIKGKWNTLKKNIPRQGFREDGVL